MVRREEKNLLFEIPVTINNIMEEISFFEKVYEVVKQIPYGRVTSYGAVANYLGTKGSARMVGWAMNKSLSAEYNIPAHRVVNKAGMLTGKHHFGGSDLMKQLLEDEGIKIADDTIVGFEECFWDPGVELAVDRNRESGIGMTGGRENGI